MRDIFFISSIVNEEDAININYSIASQLYQKKLLKVWPFKEVFSFNVSKSVSKASYAKKNNLNFCTYPATKWKRPLYACRFILFTLKRIKKGDALVYYNITERNFLSYLYFHFVRGLPCYVVLADYGPPSKSKRFWFFHHLIKRSDGILSLSPFIKIHSNMQVQQLLVDPAEASFGETPPGNLQAAGKNILFSGSIGYTTGVHVAIEAMQYLPDHMLHISGIMYCDMDESYMRSLIEKTAPGRIKYHGVLSRNEYLTLMEDCQLCLSLRDTSSEDHFYNFPSKIGEYLYFNKIVISSLSYPGFENRLLITGWNPKQLAETILKAEINGIDNREWLEENFGLNSMHQKLFQIFNTGRNG